MNINEECLIQCVRGNLPIDYSPLSSACEWALNELDKHRKEKITPEEAQLECKIENLKNRIKVLENKLDKQADKYKNVLTCVSTNGLNDALSLQLAMPSACKWALGEIERLSEDSTFWFDEFERIESKIVSFKTKIEYLTNNVTQIASVCVLSN